MSEGTQSDPFDSLANVPDLDDQVRIGLERGSVFRNGYLSGTSANAVVAAYGEGASPMIDLSDRVNPSDWAPVEGRANVYRVPVPVPRFMEIPENEVQEQLYEDGTELPAQETVGDVEAAPGSFHLDRSGDPWHLYYHATNSRDPSEGEGSVEYAARPIGVNLAGRGLDGTGGRIEGLKIRRPLAFRGCAAVGADGTIDRCVFYEGGKHHTVHPGGTLKDTLFVRSTVNRWRVFASACVWFQGQGVTEKQPVEVEYALFRELTAFPFDHHTQGAGWITPSRAMGIVLYETQHPGQLPSPLKCDGGYSYHSRGGITRVRNGEATYRRYMIDGLGEDKGSDLMKHDFLLEDSVVVDEILSRQPDSDAEITVRNCVVIGPFIQDQAGNSPTVRFENCVFLALTGGVVDASIDVHPESDRCVFFSARSNTETRFVGEERSLSALQADTGAFSNAAWLSGEQFRDLYPEWRRGNFVIPLDADVTHADGTVSRQLPDGTSLQDLGPQTHWDWNNRRAAEGPPRQWPTPPVTEDEDDAYIQRPNDWDWNGAPIAHRSETSLAGEIAAFWPMNGTAGGPEPDQVGANPLETVGGAPGAGSAPNWTYRSFDGGKDYLQQDIPTDTLGNLPNLWMCLPIRPASHAKQTIIHGRVAGNKGFVVALQSDGTLSARMHIGFPPGPTPFVSTRNQVAIDAWAIVQVWYNRTTGTVGIQVDGEDAVVVYAGHKSFVRTLGYPFAVGAQKNGGGHFDGSIGPIMVATVPPQREDREWVYNEGKYRSLAAFESHTVEVLDI